MAAGRKTGGRQKGAKNRKTAEKVAAIIASGKTPLEYMLEVMRSPDADRSVRLDAAKSAAPYVHPKLATVEHSGPDGGPIKQVHRIERVIVRPANSDG